MKKEKIIIYQILPRLFGNTKSLNAINGSIEENGVGKLSAFSTDVLQAIKKMGFTHIWYTGLLEHATQTDYSKYGIRNDHPAIVKGKAGSPYAIKDYYDIDPDLAENVPNRMKELEALVERTHEAGLKMIMDFVPNHVARQYHSDVKPEGVVDLGENDNRTVPFDRNNNFYYFPEQAFSPEFELTIQGNTYSEFPAKATGNDCFSPHPCRNDWYETVKLNYGVDYSNGNHFFDPVPKTWFQMFDILRFWASKHIDGFRCDMAEMVPVEFWEWLIPQLKQEFPNILFIAEVYDPNRYRDYLRKGKFDYLYNKVGLYDTLRAITCGNQSARAITYCWQTVDDIHAQMLNFLENHDEQRIASDFFAGDAWKAIPALVVSATMYQNPFMIYAGQESGEKGMDAEGFSGLDGRTTIFDYWSVESLRNWYNHGKINSEALTSDQKRLRNLYIRILALCNTSLAVREGKFFDLMYVNPPSADFNPDKQYAFMRYAGNELLLIAVNFDDRPVDIRVFLPEQAFSYFEIDETCIRSAKELLTGTVLNEKVNRNSAYPIRLEKYHAKMIRFVLKSEKN
ncbi:MAG: alpha-amylase family protein [Candidatus Azobacteroides sp.]|nr:alpha-amylase family protein [Candidatus Azobacteroides sp.]